MNELFLKKEIEQLDNNSIISIVKNGVEDLEKLQIAWMILQERGLKDQILNEIEKENSTDKLSIEELLSDSDIQSETFKKKVQQNVGKEIFSSQKDILGVDLNSRITVSKIDEPIISASERSIMIRKARIRFILFAISFAIALLLFASNITFQGKVVVELSLVVHSLFSLFQAYSIYRIDKEA